MSPKQRIKALLNHSGLDNFQQLAAALGVSGQGLRDIVREKETSGGNPIGISNRLAEMILRKFPEINAAWLLTGEGPMVGDKRANSIESVPDPDTIAAQKETISALKDMVSLQKDHIELQREKIKMLEGQLQVCEERSKVTSTTPL